MDIYGYVKVIPKNFETGEFEIKVSEKTVPTNYNGISETILTIKYDENGNITNISPAHDVVDNVSIDTAPYPEKDVVGWYNNNGKWVVRVYNYTRIINNLTLVKTDLDGNKLAGVNFNIYFNNISYIKIGDTQYFVEEAAYNEAKAKAEENGDTITDTAVLLEVDKAMSIIHNNKTYSIKRQQNGTDTNRLTVYGLTTNSNGEIVIPEILASSGINKNIYVTVTEAETISGYSKLPTSLRLVIKYDLINQKWKISKRNGEGGLYNELGDEYCAVDSNNTLKFTLKNNGNIIEQLTILKKDVLTGGNVDGAVFSLTFDNVEKVENTNAISRKVTFSKAVSDGKIEISDIVIDNLSEPVTVKITETSAPDNYKKIDGTITLTLTRNGSTLSGSLSKDNTILDTEVSTNSLTINGSANTVTIDIKNREVINLSGQVWLDAQEGEKSTANPDEKKGINEQKIQGVKVYLYSVKENKIISTTTTSSNGTYSFNNVTKTAEGYKIYFEYNGILYNDVGIKGDSKSAEIDSERTAFNNRFKTIDVNGANDGTSLTYNYSNKESKLNTSVDGGTPTNSSIKAYTGVYKVTTANIDCGLTSKYYDLRVDNLINNIEYTINGKTLEENVGENITTYNASIFYSDYYYRYDDYSEKIAEFDDEILRKDALQTAELEAYVTYKLLITNQNIHTTNNVSVNYTYSNSKYELLSIDGEPKTGTGKITLTATNLTSTNNAKEILIKFRVRKDNEENLPSDIATPNGFTVETVAEITSYTTQEGALIDVDSQPENGKEEDDLSKATVNFKLKEEAREISGNVAEDNNSDGTLDDTQINDVIVQLIEIVQGKDGKTYEYIWQETYTGSNQVKARSTNNNVYTYTNKLQGDTKGKYQFLGYEVKTDDSVGLKTGFIPGNYVIRFIYGDGTTLYLGRTEFDNVAKYNGQDYKSTIDKSYQEEWYNNANYDGKSTARDNEARRLEVMAFSTEIDGKLGVALNTLNKDLNQFKAEDKTLLEEYYNSLDKTAPEVKFAYNASIGNPYGNKEIKEDLSEREKYNLVKYYVSYKTWMCAETSKINVGETGDEFTNVNFGLMERPTTTLTLEKYITALKITPTGTGVQPVIDASIDVKTYYDEDTNNDKPKGITTGLATIGSTRTNRGFWKVETDIEELMQGAKLEVEYTYVIKNNSEKEDYLSEFLISSFNNSSSDDYKALLQTKSNEVKTSNLDKGLTNNYGTFLGEFYYTGTKGSNDKLITSKADKLEQSINNNLSYTEGISGEAFVKVSENVSKNIYDENGNLAQEQIGTIVQTATPTINLEKENKDYSKVLRLETTLSSSNNGEIGTTIPSYIAEITKYSNAAGRENFEAIPENLQYVHSDDTEMTMESNEVDEFWGETIIISKPTGADKNTVLLITIIAISSVAVLGVGIILIKKFVLKK